MRRLLLLAAWLIPAACGAAGEQLAWRGVWVWSLPMQTEADLVAIADAGQALGFNALLMSPPAALRARMRGLCHERGMTLYLSTVFSPGPEGCEQVLPPEEQARLAEPQAEEYMFGGEPVLPGEILRGSLPCYSRPEVRQHFREMVQRNAAEPVDGLAFDYIGWQNYHCCDCPVCEEQLAAYRREHPGLPAVQAEAQFAEQVLVSFTNEMAAAAREARPGIALTIHIYPWFAPDPYYGQRTDIDYVGQTVSWFFRPHWPLQKVRRRTAQVVAAQHECYPDHRAAPFIAFDPRRPRDFRSARRVAAEVQIVRDSGATAIQFAELGYLLQKPTVAEAVARGLGGAYRATW